MNVDIASRLVTLRKKFGYSQEGLAEQLGISRQAVSKWERAEASPDTDNLITLAKLYGVSLDELLNTELGIPETETRKEQTSAEGSKDNSGDYDPDSEENNGGFKSGIHINDKGDEVHIGWDGIRVKEKNGSNVRIGWNGIKVNDPEVEVNVSSDGVYVRDAEGKYKAKVGGAPISDEQKADDYEDWEDWLSVHDRKKNIFQRLPLGIIAIIVFLIIGSVTGIWHPTWMIFILVPIIDSFITAVAKRDFHRFAYPVLTAEIYLWMGFMRELWHPGWIIFLTIPVYYAIFPKKKFRKKDKTKPETI